MKQCIVSIIDILFMHALHAVIISPNAGAILTSVEFLYYMYKKVGLEGVKLHGCVCMMLTRVIYFS